MAGPVVAGAVILHDFRFTLPIDDSKRMTPLAREHAYRAILRRASVGVGAVGAEEIDRIGIGKATHLAMARALAKLPVAPGLVLVDGNSVPRDCPLTLQANVRGDSKSLSVACASIVAKVVRDQWMDLVHALHPEYGFRRHKGYGTQRHVRCLKQVGPCRFHRFSFAPIRAE